MKIYVEKLIDAPIENSARDQANITFKVNSLAGDFVLISVVKRPVQ
jgi:hypothetical protein